MEGIFAVGLRVGECVLALVRWGACLLGRCHPLWRIAVSHGTHARWRKCTPRRLSLMLEESLRGSS